MNITVNGNKKEIDNIKNVKELLNFLFEKNEGIIVELNGEIVHRDSWVEQLVKAGDVVELIQFIGGG
ncbi:MAG: sulfur carrier protein ThiS [bacterium]|nr:sulfur carrier protein ThiS [bacterium]